MRRLLPLAAVGAGILAGCGSQTKTVTVSSAPAATTPTTNATTQTTSAQPPAQTTKTSPGSTSPTRTAPEPSFAEGEGTTKAGSLPAAVALVKAHGFTPVNTSEYHPGQTLRVLVATRTGSGDGYGQQAFFFVNGRYIGTDAAAPSAALRVVNQGDTEVTLGYPLYRKGDPLCCPSGGTRSVRFQLNNGRLTALDPIPPVSSASGFARQ
jgi:hypothetical protein